MLTRLTPKTIWYWLIPQLILMVMIYLAVNFKWWPQYSKWAWFYRNTASIIAFAVALALHLEIAKEYRRTPLLHFAWLALAANAGISVIRMILEGPWLTLIWSEYDRSLRGLWQHQAIIPANIALLIGVIAMCLAYHRVGLGFEVIRRDYVLMAISAVILIGLLAFREGLTEAQSPYLAGRYLQQFGLFLLALIAAVCVLLQRMAMQMGGGQLANVLRLITFYAFARSTIVLVSAIRPIFPASTKPVLSCITEMAWLLVVWLPALAAAYRLQMTVNAAQKLTSLSLRPRTAVLVS